MKPLAAVATIALTFSAAVAQAGDLSRAQVLEELHRAQTQGLVVVGENPYPATINSAHVKSRAQVLNELATAQASGCTIVGDFGEYPMASIQGRPDATRAQILDELREYASQSGHNVPA